MMTETYRNYSKTETGTKRIIYWDAVTLFLPPDKTYGDFSVDSDWVYTPGVSPKNQYTVY